MKPAVVAHAGRRDIQRLRPRKRSPKRRHGSRKIG
jgi:hypothetical protein